MATKNIPEILRKLRKERKMPQRVIAEKLGMSRSAYAYCEEGKTKISLKLLTKLSKILDVHYNVFLDNERTRMVMADPGSHSFFKEKIEYLTNEESKLLKFYRKLDDENKEKILIEIKKLNGAE